MMLTFKCYFAIILLKEDISMEEFIEFITDNWVVILTVLAQVLASIITIIKLIKNNKNLKLGSTAIQLIMEDLPDLITLAEKISGLDGTAKKEYVMREVQLKLSSMGVIITQEDLLTLSDMVDSLVSLSKSINLYGSVKVSNIDADSLPSKGV